MKRAILSVAAVLATAVPGFCGLLVGAPEPKSATWMYGVALLGVAGFAFFKRSKKN